MLDVHAPSHTPNGTRDFLIHLFTITIGLLIALGLEGAVEWQHHRHLVREAKASLAEEIRNNESQMADTLKNLKEEQKTLDDDVDFLNEVIKLGKMPEHGHLGVNFNIHTFESVGWKTAENTGALAYMSYDEAQQYSGIYAEQASLEEAEIVAGRDAVLALSPLLNVERGHGGDFTGQTGVDLKQKIENLQGQLLIVDSYMNSLERQYKHFLSANQH